MTREVAGALALVRAGLAAWSPGISAFSREAARRGAVVEAHWSLNAVNACAVEQLADLGASTVWLSPELSGRQIAELARRRSACRWAWRSGALRRSW